MAGLTATFEAALLYHLTASAAFSGTPSPFSYMKPRHPRLRADQGCPDSETVLRVDIVGGCAPGDERVQTAHCLTFDLREEPSALVAHAGICAGGAGQPVSLPRPFPGNERGDNRRYLPRPIGDRERDRKAGLHFCSGLTRPNAQPFAYQHVKLGEPVPDRVHFSCSADSRRLVARDFGQALSAFRSPGYQLGLPGDGLVSDVQLHHE